MWNQGFVGMKIADVLQSNMPLLWHDKTNIPRSNLIERRLSVNPNKIDMDLMIFFFFFHVYVLKLILMGIWFNQSFYP